MTVRAAVLCGYVVRIKIRPGGCLIYYYMVPKLQIGRYLAKVYNEQNAYLQYRLHLNNIYKRIILKKKCQQTNIRSNGYANYVLSLL